MPTLNLDRENKVVSRNRDVPYSVLKQIWIYSRFHDLLRTLTNQKHQQRKQTIHGVSLMIFFYPFLPL